MATQIQLVTERARAVPLRLIWHLGERLLSPHVYLRCVLQKNVTLACAVVCVMEPIAPGSRARGSAWGCARSVRVDVRVYRGATAVHQ